jgi:hypothetical protein
MEKKHFSLEINSSNKLTRIFQLIFGIICIGVAIAWLVVNINTISSNITLIITIVFLLGFAYYQINSGLGKGEKFIEINESEIILKKNSVLPSRSLKATDIEKIEVYPIKIEFLIKSGKRIILRLGTTYIDSIVPVKESIDNFCELNKIPHEMINEEL